MGSVRKGYAGLRWTLDDQQGSVFQLGEGEPSPTGHLGYGYAQGNVDFWSEHKVQFSLLKAHQSPVLAWSTGRKIELAHPLLTIKAAP